MQSPYTAANRIARPLHRVADTDPPDVIFYVSEDGQAHTLLMDTGPGLLSPHERDLLKWTRAVQEREQ